MKSVGSEIRRAPSGHSMSQREKFQMYRVSKRTRALVVVILFSIRLFDPYTRTSLILYSSTYKNPVPFLLFSAPCILTNVLSLQLISLNVLLRIAAEDT